MAVYGKELDDGLYRLLYRHSIRRSEGRCELWFRNFKIFADLLCKKVINLSMTGNGRCFAGRAVYIDAVIATLAKKLDIVMFEVADQIDPLHEIRARGSRMTVLSRRLSSANARLATNTSSTAS